MSTSVQTELPGGATPMWRDGKRYAWILGGLVPLFVLDAWGLVSLTGLSAFWWFGPLFLYVVMPVLDSVIGADPTNPPDSVLGWLENDRYYRWCTYLFLPLQFAALVLACWLMSRGGMDVVDRIGLAVTVGTINGVAINTAHELGHKKDHLERWLSKIALAPTFYGHFYVEHNKGHHVRVATPDDPASSRLGESFWRFLPRTVRGSLVNGWRVEARRLRRLGRPTFSAGNDVLKAWAMSVVLWVGLVAGFGVGILPYLLVQAVFGFAMLEAVNYLEHYGLARRQLPNGRFERVDARHSWNSNNISSNVLLYHLQRHSDHHANPTRRYQSLRHFEESPQLPAGYATMIVLAYVPPLWRHVMDHRVLEHYAGDVTCANIDPRTRERVLARHVRRAEAA